MFGAGCAAYFSLSSEPATIVLIISGLLFAGSAAVMWQRRNLLGERTFYAVLFTLFFVSGFLFSAARTHMIEPNRLSRALDRVMVEGWVVETSRSATGRERLLIQIHAISGMSPDELPSQVRISQRKNGGFYPGRFIRCYANIGPPPAPALSGEYDFARDAFFSRIDGIGYTFGQCAPGAMQEPNELLLTSRNHANAFRQSLASFINEKAGRGGGLAAALMTGNRSYLSVEDEETLRSAGMAHLLAISGLHMGLAGGAFYFLFFRALALIEPLSARFPVQKIAAVAALTSVTGYLIVSGASVSAQRAYVMVAIAFLALLFDKPALSFQTLAVAVFAVLLLTPWAVISPGFQMSFLAAGSLIRVFAVSPDHKAGHKQNPIVGFLKPIILTSVVAGMATAPFAIFHFSRVATWGIPANFIIMPLFTLVSVPLAVMSVVFMPFGLGEIPLAALGLSLEWVLKLARFFADDSAAGGLFVMKPFTALSLVTITFGMLVLIIHGWQGIKLAAVLALTGAGIWMAQDRTQVIFSPTGHILTRTEPSNELVVYEFKGAGLKPLSFIDYPEIRCDQICQFDSYDRAFFAERSSISQDETVLVLKTLNGDKPVRLASAAHIRIDHDKLIIKKAAPNRCRPWSNDWPVCRR
ncbi:ComEC/Rec2 family competence protein [Ponticaulis profundi]|uniref:ComEC/Rec2 family competence protein n=1 Tax=Ponticaulis profundi TaxID=2665222 RepID=A0ABW1SFA8_9PROT